MRSSLLLQWTPPKVFEPLFVGKAVKECGDAYRKGDVDYSEGFYRGNEVIKGNNKKANKSEVTDHKGIGNEVLGIVVSAFSEQKPRSKCIEEQLNLFIGCSLTI
ncbi:MAG: hypothetical protein ACI8TS_002298 [Flavobacteriales bacterium]|jgi:hypothetical protein